MDSLDQQILNAALKNEPVIIEKLVTPGADIHYNSFTRENRHCCCQG